MILKAGENAIAIGKVTKEPVEKETKTGRKVTNFSIRYGYDKQNETGRFIDIGVWGDAGRAVVQTIQKGDQVAVAGKMTSRQSETNGRTYWSISAEWVMPDISVINSMIPDGEEVQMAADEKPIQEGETFDQTTGFDEIPQDGDPSLFDDGQDYSEELPF